MALTKLQFRPGINRETTSHTNEGGWQDCDKIRFRSGFPETIGGWERFTSDVAFGTCRNLHTWNTLSNESYVSVGTHLKHYLVRGTALFDTTPVRATTAAGDVTFSATLNSNTVTVSHTAHGALLNDFVTFSGAVSLGGTITADLLNAEHQIQRIVDANSYEIYVGAVATASDSGNGGASVVGEYQINTGLESAAFGDGWGADPWSAGGWGSAADTSIPGAQLRLWSADNYGEDLFFCVRNGAVFYWDATTGTAVRGGALEDLSGANKAPTVARVVMTSDRDRHALAFGCDDEFSIGTQDPLLIRFSAQEDITDWETRADNTAGSLRISSGSGIVTAVKTRQQVIVFTDVSLHAMQYIGAPFTFGLTELSVNITIAGPQAAVAVNDSVFWMGEGDFYLYDGRVQKIPCSVREYVFSRLDIAQAQKITAAHNSEHSEIWWFYQSVDGSENDSYVVYNYAQNIWYYGTLERTAWQQRGIFGYSIGAGPPAALALRDSVRNLSTGLILAALSGTDEEALFETQTLSGRPLGDVTGGGTVTASDAVQILKWENSASIPDDQRAWIEESMIPYMIENAERYRKYLSPAAFGTSLYYHESGINDGSTNPSSAIHAYIESSPVDMGEGDRYMFASQLIPDITFRSSTGTPSVTMTLKARNWPGDGYLAKEEDNPVTRSATVPVEKFPRDIDIRLRGRSMSIRIESNERNTAWRLGTPRLNVRTDGTR